MTIYIRVSSYLLITTRCAQCCQSAGTHPHNIPVSLHATPFIETLISYAQDRSRFFKVRDHASSPPKRRRSNFNLSQFAIDPSSMVPTYERNESWQLAWFKPTNPVSAWKKKKKRFCTRLLDMPHGLLVSSCGSGANLDKRDQHSRKHPAVKIFVRSGSGIKMGMVMG